jgi:hypothetical protein
MFRGELAGLDLGDVQHGIDEAQQVLAVGADAGEGIKRLRSLRLVEAFLDKFGIPENGRERRSEFVAHVGHELVLVLARDLKIFDGLCKLTRPSLYLLEQPRVLDGDDCLVGLAHRPSFSRSWTRLLRQPHAYANLWPPQSGALLGGRVKMVAQFGGPTNALDYPLTRGSVRSENYTCPRPRCDGEDRKPRC